MTPLPFVVENVEPVLTEQAWWACPWPGCPDKRTPNAKSLAREHAALPHVRCSCGRYFSERGLPAHRGQTIRYGTEHPPFPDDDS